MSRNPKRQTSINLGGLSVVVVGEASAPGPPPVGGGEDEDLPVTRTTTNSTLTASDTGTLIVDSSGGIRTITLPLLSTLGADGFVLTVKRHGVNYVDVDTSGSDTFENGTSTIRLFTAYSAVKVVADSAAGVYYLQGYFGAIT